MPLSGRFVWAKNRIESGFFALKALSCLRFLKVGSNRNFCRFWGENREDRGEKTEEGNTKNMHRRTELQTDKIYVRGVSNE